MSGGLGSRTTTPTGLSLSDEYLRDVLWLIDCERDAVETTGGKLDAVDNIERRVRGHFGLGPDDLYPSGVKL